MGKCADVNLVRVNMGKDILYETMKVIAQQRNIKASPDDDLYKKE